MQPVTQKAKLEMTFTNQFGNKTSVSFEPDGETVYDIFICLGLAMKAFGYSEENIREYVPDC